LRTGGYLSCHPIGYLTRKIVDKALYEIVGLTFVALIWTIIKVLAYKAVDYLGILIVDFILRFTTKFIFILVICSLFFSIVTRVLDYSKFKPGDRFIFGSALYFIGFEGSGVINLRFL
jgi:hypothetical protein